MANVLFANNASTTLAAGITNVATSLTVATGTGSLFPTITGSDYFYATLTNAAGTKEIIKVTARSTDTFTVTRAQEGTSAVAWNLGDTVELRVTAQGLNDIRAQAGIGAVTSTSGATDITLTSASNGYQSVTMTAMGKSVNLPSATTLSVGGPKFIIKNDGGYPFGIRDNAGTLVGAVASGGIAYVTLKDSGSAAGSWSIIGDNLEPGLITIDSTFSSTYASTVLAPFVALDSNTSIHFAALSSGFAAFVVDNTGKVVSTPVTVSSTASSVPKTVFKVSATSAIVFFGSSTTDNQAVVLTLTGSSPSYSLSVGTPQNINTYTLVSAGWDGENFTGAPKIAQLSSTLFAATFHSSGGPTTGLLVAAVSVSGATITIGTPVRFDGGANVASSSTTCYALTATTALVLYKVGGPAPYANYAIVATINGTSWTLGTAVALTGCASSVGTIPASALLSSTKCIVIDDNNTTGSVITSVFTIAGTVITAGTALSVETGITTSCFYTSNSATRYNPHLFPLSASTALLWYLDSSGISRAVVLSESAGTVTAGTILYGSISTAGSTADGGGAIFPQGTAEFVSLKNEMPVTSVYRLRVHANKISGTAITSGASASKHLDTLSLGIGAGAVAQAMVRLSSGDYSLIPSGNAWMTGFPIFRSNGDFINYRGDIACPTGYNLSTPNSGGRPAAFSNRMVVMQSTAISGSTGGASASQLRLLNVEICA